MLEKLSPIMPSSDIAASEAFWVRLGFATIYRDKDSYLLLKREGAELHFWHKPGLDPVTNDCGALLRPSDISTFDAECRALDLPDAGIPRYVPAEDKPWAMREAVLVDPDGNVFRAAQELPLD